MGECGALFLLDDLKEKSGVMIIQQGWRTKHGRVKGQESGLGVPALSGWHIFIFDMEITQWESLVKSMVPLKILSK